MEGEFKSFAEFAVVILVESEKGQAEKLSSKHLPSARPDFVNRDRGCNLEYVCTCLVRYRTDDILLC